MTPILTPGWRRTGTGGGTALEARKQAEAKMSAFLDALTPDEEALLFRLLRDGKNWTSDRAKAQLQQCGWWL